MNFSLRNLVMVGLMAAVFFYVFKTLIAPNVPVGAVKTFASAI